MKKSNIIGNAFVNALGTALYVIVVASFLYNGSLKKLGESPSVLIPITMLMLFVFSAALVGFLIFGRPVMWYLDGKKKEALKLLLYTLGILFILTIIAVIILFLVR